MSALRHYFICGIGGSGMLPLAVILKGMGHRVSGSDRSYDQGRTPEKFAWIKTQGIALYPQDGSGITGDVDEVVVTKAVEDTVPDIAAAHAKNIPVTPRAKVLIRIFNHYPKTIAVAGTSGKTTTTGMIGYIYREHGADPTVMNGGIFKNYAGNNPYSTAFVGKSDIFITEVDESDGKEILTLYDPDIAVLHNVTLDHQSMDDLRDMFSDFIGKAKTVAVNIADAVAAELAENRTENIITYGVRGADIWAENYEALPDGSKCVVRSNDPENDGVELRLRVPGKHNVSNALAALAVASRHMTLERACTLLSRFEGIKRRMDVIGTKGGITVIDDFAHNPDKIAATLETLQEFPGRLLIFFQPHGYGFLKVVGKEVGETFAEHLSSGDKLYLTEPLYMGGTVDKSVGASCIVSKITEKNRFAQIFSDRDEIMKAIVNTAKNGDRIIVMGARDDTLSDFAAKTLEYLP